MIQTPPFEPMPLQLRPLPYPFEALAPVLSERQVEVHYTQHHAAYVEKANAILATAGGPAGLSRAPARAWERWDFNSRGAWLHDLWWDTITPGGSDPTQFLVEHLGGPGALLRLHADLLQAGLDVQGSGWVFLSRFEDGDLRVHSSPNHDYVPRDASSNCYPVVVIDVWEHAYYLDYTADRQAYLERLIGLINWPMVEHRLLGREGPGPGRKNA